MKIGELIGENKKPRNKKSHDRNSIYLAASLQKGTEPTLKVLRPQDEVLEKKVPPAITLYDGHAHDFTLMIHLHDVKSIIKIKATEGTHHNQHWGPVQSSRVTRPGPHQFYMSIRRYDIYRCETEFLGFRHFRERHP